MSKIKIINKSLDSKRELYNYFKAWEKTSPNKDPLLRQWKKHIEETKGSCNKVS